jgi:hypothetical protein
VIAWLIRLSMLAEAVEIKAVFTTETQRKAGD